MIKVLFKKIETILLLILMVLNGIGIATMLSFLIALFMLVGFHKKDLFALYAELTKKDNKH